MSSLCIAFLLPTPKVTSFASGELPGSGSPSDFQTTLDPSFKRMMVYIFVGTLGGQNRARIVEMLRNDPSNLNKISEKLNLDYKTVQHHIRMLEENDVLVASSKGAYGAVYFLTPYFEKHFDTIRKMWAGFGQSQI
jgi:predicted transcriptional regulator